MFCTALLFHFATVEASCVRRKIARLRSLRRERGFGRFEKGRPDERATGGACSRSRVLNVTNLNGKSRLEFFLLFFCEMAIKVSHIYAKISQIYLNLENELSDEMSDEQELLLLRTPFVWVCNYPVRRRTAVSRYLWREMGYTLPGYVALFMTRLTHIALSRKLLETFLFLPLWPSF